MELSQVGWIILILVLALVVGTTASAFLLWRLFSSARRQLRRVTKSLLRTYTRARDTSRRLKDLAEGYRRDREIDQARHEEEAAERARTIDDVLATSRRAEEAARAIREDLARLQNTLDNVPADTRNPVAEIRDIVDRIEARSHRLERRSYAIASSILPAHWTSLPILVTGCGRSGTHYTAKVLGRSGYDALHEVAAGEVTVSWPHASGEYRKDAAVSFEKIIHQHRHPLKSIASILTLNEKSWRHVATYCPQCEDKSPLRRAVLYWMHWNEMAREGAAFSFAIESLASEATIEKFRSHAGLIIQRAALEQDHSLASRSSWKTYREVGVNDIDEVLLPTERVAFREMSEAFGYELVN